jgi:hypothetical protein
MISIEEIKMRTEIKAMLSGSPVTTAWRVLKLRTEETAPRYGE